MKWKNFTHYWPIVRGIFTGHRWILLTKARDAQLWCFFDLRLNKRLSKQSRRRWFETPLPSLWRLSNDILLGRSHGRLICIRKILCLKRPSSYWDMEHFCFCFCWLEDEYVWKMCNFCNELLVHVPSCSKFISGLAKPEIESDDGTIFVTDKEKHQLLTTL